MNIRPHIMTIAKGLSSGYQPIGGSLICDEVAEVINNVEFNHGYTYSGHPVACAVALENLRILDEEGIVTRVREQTGPYLKEKFESLAEHPLVGEAKIIGMMGSIALTPDKASRAAFEAEAGTVGFVCRERCFANNLIMRHVGDRMIISPSLVISHDEIDTLIERAWQSLDECHVRLKDEGLMKARVAS
jgi:putrescine aminotransferase